MRACDERKEENREAGRSAGVRVPPCLPYLPEMRLEEAEKKSSTPTRCCPESVSEEGRKERKSVGVEGRKRRQKVSYF